jgi:hypothetical protein
MGVFTAALAVAVASCVGTSGGQVVDFHAAAAGPDGITNPYEFMTDPVGASAAYHVVLTQATLHIGALYLDQTLPVSGSQGTACILPSTYVGEVLAGPGGAAGLDVDLLSPTPQPFADGHGTTYPPALAAQVWLTGGDINATDDTTAILVLEGTIDQGGMPEPFSGKITIGANRASHGTAAAGGDPICKERIVTVPTSVAVRTTGGLLIRVDPQLLFTNVDWSKLGSSSSGLAFVDGPSSPMYTQPSRNLYQNLRSAGSLYTLSWVDDL